MTPHRLVLYSKPGCHLCEDALAMVRDLSREFALTIEEIDIERDDALFKKYFDKIPVLMIDGSITLAAPLRRQDIRAALK